MNQTTNGYVSDRVLKLNVGFLLSDGPGYTHDSDLNIPTLRVADDLLLNYLHGPLRLSRTKEGILVQAKLHIGVENECSRCLTRISQDIIVNLEELFAYPPSHKVEFSISEGGILDIAPLLRDEILIETSHTVFCKTDCKGLCPTCGINLNEAICSCNPEFIDPRLAPLRELLD